MKKNTWKPTPVERPIESKRSGAVGGRRWNHPAFGQIVAHRQQGCSAALYGSDMLHDVAVCVTIHRSVLERDLARDWHFNEGPPIIELLLSEAQWAEFITSMNVGTGTTCTFSRLDGHMVPRLPDPDLQGTWRNDFDRTATDALAAIDDAIKALEDAGLPKGKAAAIREKVVLAQRKMSDSLPFIASKFGEHMETVVSKASSEIHARMMHAVTTAGLEALGAKKPAITNNEEGDGE